MLVSVGAIHRYAGAHDTALIVARIIAIKKKLAKVDICRPGQQQGQQLIREFIEQRNRARDFEPTDIALHVGRFKPTQIMRQGFARQ